MANIARLAAVLGLDTAEFQQGLASAKRSLQSFVEKIPAAAAVAGAAFAAMSYKAMAMADQMSDLADATDMTIESILGISEALEQSGGKAEAADKVLIKFIQTVDEAAQGSKTAQDAFARVGISLKDLANPDNADLFNKTVEGIAQLGNKASQTGAAIDIFGKGIKGVDMAGFNEKIKEGEGHFGQYAVAVRQAADLHDKLAKRAHEMNLMFTNQVMPTLNSVFDIFLQKGGMAELVMKGLKYMLIGVYDTLGNIDTTFSEYQARWSSISKGNLFYWNDPEYQKTSEENAKKEFARLSKIQHLIAGTQSAPLPGAPSADRSPRSVKAAKDTELNQLLKELETLKLISQQYTARLDEQAKLVQLKTQMVFLTVNESQVAEAMYQLDKERAEAVGKLMDKRQTAIDLKADQQVIDMLDEQIAKVNETTDAYKEQIKGLIEYQQQLEQSYMGGIYLSYKKYQDMAINNAATVEAMVDSLFDNMMKSIDTFVQTGKFSFKDFANSVIQDLIRIAIRAQMLKLFSMMLNWGAGAAGGGEIEGAIPLNGGSITDAAAIGASGVGQMRAAGGGVTSGSPYLVGERGPELFVPGRSGSVIPNNELSNMGGQPSVVYNGPYIANMSAIDTQSATQFLAKNRAAVYSANMSASRSMPTSVK